MPTGESDARRSVQSSKGAQRDGLRACICVILFVHFFVPAIEPPTRESLLDPPGGICPDPSPVRACAWSYGMTWLVSRLLCSVPWLSVHHPHCRIVTACAACVPIWWCVNCFASVCFAFAIYWAPAPLLFCGKRTAKEGGFPEDRDGAPSGRRKRKCGATPTTPAYESLVSASLSKVQRDVAAVSTPEVGISPLRADNHAPGRPSAKGARSVRMGRDPPGFKFDGTL